MNKNLSDFAVDGINGRFADNPVPNILAGLEVGSALKGFSPLIKLIPAGDTVLVPLSLGGGIDWYAAFAGDGLVFLRATKATEVDTVIEATDEPSAAAFANLMWIMSQTGVEPDDFDLEVIYDPGG